MKELRYSSSGLSGGVAITPSNAGAVVSTISSHRRRAIILCALASTTLTGLAGCDRCTALTDPGNVGHVDRTDRAEADQVGRADRAESVANHRHAYCLWSRHVANALIAGNREEAIDMARKMFREVESHDSVGPYLSDLKAKSRRDLMVQAMIAAYQDQDLQTSPVEIDRVHGKDIDFVISAVSEGSSVSRPIDASFSDR